MAKLDRNMITITQAAELAGCSGGYVRRMLRAGKIDGVKITERMWLVSKRDVLALSKELSARARKNS